MKTQKSPRLLLQVHTAIAAIKHWENIITPCRPAAMASRCTFRHMVMWGAVLALGLLLRTTHAQNAYNIEYLCCDWGPAMTLPSNTNEVVKFNEKEEEVYFLKQVASRSPKSVNIYLCKMKADGSDKTELKELWRNPSFPIDTQGQSTWMDVNRKARKLALSITYAGSDIDGLWVIKLDGCDLRRIITPICTTNYLQAINHPSWTPDGEWLVFEEELRGTNPNQHRIAKCDKDGKNFVLLTKGPWQDQPSVFPDGRSIIYGQVGDAKTGGIYLMDIEGNSPHHLFGVSPVRHGHVDHR